MLKLSIITPVYKGVKFIDSCIQNVIDQNCSEIEHIIIDGDSTDTTIEIIKQYAKQYPHIRFLSEPDKGQSDAMNTNSDRCAQANMEMQKESMRLVRSGC